MNGRGLIVEEMKELNSLQLITFFLLRRHMEMLRSTGPRMSSFLVEKVAPKEKEEFRWNREVAKPAPRPPFLPNGVIKEELRRSTSNPSQEDKKKLIGDSNPNHAPRSPSPGIPRPAMSLEDPMVRYV